jgi:hypothetical protein
LYGGNFLQSTYWSVDASGPPANITNITWSPADSAWQAGLSYTFIVTGTGFGSNPLVTIMGPDNTNYYNASCTQGTQCDTYISGLVQVPSSAPSGYAMVIVTPVGFTGLGFGQNPPSPPPVTGNVPVTGAPRCPLTIQLASARPFSLPYTSPDGPLRTGIGIMSTMQVSGLWLNLDGAQIQETLSQVSNNCSPVVAEGICTGNITPFTVGAYNGGFGVPFPPQQNVFYDWHTRTSLSNVLGFTSMTSCTAICNQVYTCNGGQVGSFTIQTDFTGDTIDGGNVTRVQVNKY